MRSRRCASTCCLSSCRRQEDSPCSLIGCSLTPASPPPPAVVQRCSRRAARTGSAAAAELSCSRPAVWLAAQVLSAVVLRCSPPP
eukprot:333221-Lingulodinium_polyedra.AAC.1